MTEESETGKPEGAMSPARMQVLDVWLELPVSRVKYDPSPNSLLESARVWVPPFEAELSAYFVKHPEELHRMAPRRFEELVAHIFKNHSFDVELTPPQKDGGYDVLAVRNDPLTGPAYYLVECKRYNPARPVGVEIVRQLADVVATERAHRGIIVTTSRFTAGAREMESQRSRTLTLHDYEVLLRWMKELGLMRPNPDAAGGS